MAVSRRVVICEDREMKLSPIVHLVSAFWLFPLSHSASAAAEPDLGATTFARACAACHSLQPNRNMTGPSLAGVWGRKAGTLETFDRYSLALKSANVTWDAGSLDQWIKRIACSDMPRAARATNTVRAFHSRGLTANCRK